MTTQFNHIVLYNGNENKVSIFVELYVNLPICFQE